MLDNKKSRKVIKRIASLVLVLIMVLGALPGNLPYAVQAENTSVNAGTLTVDGRSDLTTGNGDAQSTGSFYFKGTTDTVAASLTATSQKGGVFFNGVMITNYKLTKIAEGLYWFDYQGTTSLEAGDEIMISGEFSGTVKNSTDTSTVVFEKTVFQYLGTEENSNGAWAIVKDSGEDKNADLIRLENFGEADGMSATNWGIVKSANSVDSLDGKIFVVDVLWSHNKTTGLASHSASILYASKGDTASGIGVSLWGSGTQLITRQRGSSWTDVVDHGMASGVDTSQPMRFKIRMDYVDSDLTDTDETKNDVSLNVWIEQNETEYHVVKDRIFTDMTNLGGYVEVISHGAEPTITCSNVAFEEEYLTFCDVGIADGTYSANEGVSTYTESLAGKTLVGEVSYEWLTEDAKGSNYCSIAYGGTNQKTGVQFAYRFDQNIFIVEDLVEGSATNGHLLPESNFHVCNLADYGAETLGETRKMGIKLVYVDNDNDGSADDACFTISINDKEINEKFYIQDGLYLLTNKIYVAPRHTNRSITVSSISTYTDVMLSDSVLTVTGNGSLNNTTLEEALTAAQITDKTTITEIRLEGSYSTIKENTFDGFKALERVFLTDSITKVAENAFVNCTENEVIVSNAFGNEFAGGLNAKIVHHMNVDSVGEESSFENGTLTMHVVPTETVTGVIDNTAYTGLQVQVDDAASQAVTMTKTSYGTLAFTLSNIDKTDFAVTILKGVATTSDETYTVKGFEFLEDKTFYVNEVAITDNQMAGTNVVATVNETTTDGLYFTTDDTLSTGDIYAVEGIENGVFVNGEPKEVFLRKTEVNTYNVCLADKNITIQDGDMVSVSGCFYQGDVMVHFAPFTAKYAESTKTWSQVATAENVNISETLVVDGAAEDGGNYLVEGAKATIKGYDRVSVKDDSRNIKQSDPGIWFTVSPADGLTSNKKCYGACVYVNEKLYTNVPITKMDTKLYYANLQQAGIKSVENMSVVIEGYLSDGTNGVQFERAEFRCELYGEELKWIYKPTTETDDTTVLYESGDYDVRRTIGNVTFNKKVVIYKTGDANADNVVDVRDIITIKTGNYTDTVSGTQAADTLVTSDVTDKALLLREQLVNKAESKADAVLPQLEGATGAGQYASDYITDVDATANGTTVLSITDNEQNTYKSATDFDAYGLDYVMDFSFSEDREIRILQLTDTQIVDATQQRYEGRLDPTSTALWVPENMEKLVFSYIKETVKQTQPDLILLTGDNIHGEFDDDGTLLTALINCMEELQIPWAPINGNHDNESIKGVQWQSEQYANAKYCLFNRRHAIGGNGNYSIGLAKNGELDRVVYMLDSNYCGANLTTNYEKHADYGTDNIYSMPELIDTQMEWYRVSQLRVNQVAKNVIPSFCCFHVPDAEVAKGLVWSGYQTVENETGNYTVGGQEQDSVIAQPGDSGYQYGQVTDVLLNSLYPYMKEVGCDGTFSGHLHYASTSVYYKGIRWTLGTKTGEYVSHIPGKLGGTLISLKDNAATGESFVVEQKIVTPITE